MNVYGRSSWDVVPRTTPAAEPLFRLPARGVRRRLAVRALAVFLRRFAEVGPQDRRVFTTGGSHRSGGAWPQGSRRLLDSPVSVAVNGRVRREREPMALFDLRRPAREGGAPVVCRLSCALGARWWER